MVSSSSSSALLLLVVLATGAHGTNFFINGTFNCPLNSFRYHMVVWEYDWLWHTAISHVGIEFSNRPHHYQITATDFGDGWSTTYEVGIVLVHNCNDNGNRRKLEVPVGDFPVGNKNEDYYTTVNIDVYNKGELTTDIRHRFMGDDHE